MSTKRFFTLAGAAVLLFARFSSAQTDDNSSYDSSTDATCNEVCGSPYLDNGDPSILNADGTSSYLDFQQDCITVCMASPNADDSANVIPGTGGGN